MSLNLEKKLQDERAALLRPKKKEVRSLVHLAGLYEIPIYS